MGERTLTKYSPCEILSRKNIPSKLHPYFTIHSCLKKIEDCYKNKKIKNEENISNKADAKILPSHLHSKLHCVKHLPCAPYYHGDKCWGSLADSFKETFIQVICLQAT